MCRALENAGVDAVAIHARYRQDRPSKGVVRLIRIIKAITVIRVIKY